MKLKAYAIRDVKIEAFPDRPFFVRHNAEAMRAFDAVVADKETKLNKHPEDYALFEIGAWDDESGMFEQMQVKQIRSGLESRAATSHEQGT